MPGGVYNFQGRAPLIDVLDWAPPPPRQPISLILSRHGRTDVGLILMKGALGGWSGGGPKHAQCSMVDTGLLGGIATVPEHRQSVDVCSAGAAVVHPE